jgi:hypothetical protein
VSRALLPPTRAATNAGSGRLGAIRCFENVASARSNPNFQRRAMALSGLRVKEYLDRASGQSTKNYTCSARHGRFLLRSLDYHSVETQAQQAEKPGWANYRSQHLARTPFGIASRSSRLHAFLSALGSIGSAARWNNPPTRILEATPRLAINVLLTLMTAPRPRSLARQRC